MSDGESTYIAGPCCVGSDPVTAARRIVRQHRLDRKRPYRPFGEFTGTMAGIFCVDRMFRRKCAYFDFLECLSD